MGDPKVTRMAAVLVLAAGGKIRIPLSMIAQADTINLHQDDREFGYVTYTATAYDRPGIGEIVEGESRVIESAPVRRIEGGRG